ncbi:uncharacterized protein TM35_000081030, partial [Trypanosoma theileri]
AEMIGVSLDDTSMYCLAWSWSAQKPLCITKDEFMSGMKFLGAPVRKVGGNCAPTVSLVKAPKPEFEPYLCAIRSHIDGVDEVLRRDPDQFRQFYRFLFRWVRSPETMSRSVGESGMNIDSAVELWRMLFPAYRGFPHLEEWITFCTTKDLFRRESISRDLWEQFLEFTALTRYDTYDVNDAWPSAVDDFVEYFKGKQKLCDKEE